MRRVNDDELRRLWPTRLPDKEIAARLGHHRSVVRRRAKQLGLKPRRIVWSEVETNKQT
jgi:pyrroloquinoline quinone (PQQ) biosynthesis protein C